MYTIIDLSSESIVCCKPSLSEAQDAALDYCVSHSTDVVVENMMEIVLELSPI